MLNHRRGRRIGIAAAGLAILSLAFAAIASAAGGDRLAGDFTLRGEVIEATGAFANTEGDNIVRDAFFKPLCRRGACDVRANVEVNGERMYVVLTLDRQNPGYYRGTTRFQARCGGGTSNARIIFAALATQVVDGYVRRIRARTFTSYSGSCNGSMTARLHGQKAS